MCTYSFSTPEFCEALSTSTKGSYLLTLEETSSKLECICSLFKLLLSLSLFVTPSPRFISKFTDALSSLAVMLEKFSGTVSGTLDARIGTASSVWTIITANILKHIVLLILDFKKRF